MPMSRINASVGVLVGVSVVTLLLGGVSDHPSHAQPPAPAPATPGGRYQMVVKSGPENTAVFVIDSTTGQCWFRDTNPKVTEWTDMGSPAIRVKK